MGKNLGYFFGEVRTILRLSGFSGVLSVVSMGLIFFVALLAVTGWWVSSEMVRELRSEAEISVYFPQNLGMTERNALQKAMASIQGVQAVQAVSGEDAKARMEKTLGPEAEVLANFDVNPFEAYFEVQVELDRLDPILKAVQALPGVGYVRDNRTILNRLSAITTGISALGVVVAASVCTAALIITSHIIREGVHSHRDRILTLKLLGAPDWFINTPFVMEGVLLTVLAGVSAAFGYGAVFGPFRQWVSTTLLFLPAVDYGLIQQTLTEGVIGGSVLMGVLGSAFGLALTGGRG